MRGGVAKEHQKKALAHRRELQRDNLDGDFAGVSTMTKMNALLHYPRIVLDDAAKYGAQVEHEAFASHFQKIQAGRARPMLEVIAGAPAKMENIHVRVD